MDLSKVQEIIQTYNLKITNLYTALTTEHRREVYKQPSCDN